MRPMILAALAVFTAACSGPAVHSQSPAPPSGPVDSTPPVAETETEPEAPAELPPPWWTPLEPVSLESLTPQETAAVDACLADPRLKAADVTADALFQAAQCAGRHRAYGKEIFLHKALIHRHSNSPNNAEVIIALGKRHEQLDRRDEAAEFYQLFLARYAKNDEARALGQRGVCLARSVDNEKRASALLYELERSFARDGFVSPPELGLAQLCNALPPVSR